MQPLKSSVLIVGHPNPDIHATGAAFVEDFDKANELLDSENYQVVAFTSDHKNQSAFDRFVTLLKEKHGKTQKILVNLNLEFADVLPFVNEHRVFRILNEFSEPHFQQTLQEALAEYSFHDQNDQLINLINDQNERLKKLSVDLEKRVDKRQKYLSNARKKLMVSNNRVEALHRALVSVHHASSVSDLEVSVNNALATTLNLSWTRILFEWQNVMSKQSTLQEAAFEIFSAPIVRGKELVGQIYFAREKSKPFKKDEHSFLMQVADAVTLAIDRLYRFEETQTLKQQWEATFDAVTTPVSLINKEYNIVRCNLAFAEKTGQSVESLIGKKCYEALFMRDKPCNLCTLGQAFRLTPQKTRSGKTITFEVATQELDSEDATEQLYVTLYRDISEQLKLERHVLESAKMAEIGTIGSSIAHELNNPLGGMISFLQLIKVDLKGDEPFYEDIIEMEKGAIQCKEIVQNLLSFSRLPSIDQQEELDFNKVVERSVKLTELQTKSKGIEIELPDFENEIKIYGQYHLLTQALRHILQFSISAISIRMENESGFIGNISMSYGLDSDTFTFDILTNTEFPKNTNERQNEDIDQGPEITSFGPGLDLTITDQIIVEHNGTLEIISQNDSSFLVKVTLPRLST